MSRHESFQQRHIPDGRCFGCGPRNDAGLRIDSYAASDGTMVCDWTPRQEHGNGAGSVCGGILGSILDCHAVTAAGRALEERDGTLKLAVTKQFAVEFLCPAPMEPLHLVARVTELRERSAAVEATAVANGELCARFEGVFVVPRRSPSS